MGQINPRLGNLKPGLNGTEGLSIHWSASSQVRLAAPGSWLPSKYLPCLRLAYSFSFSQPHPPQPLQFSCPFSCTFHRLEKWSTALAQGRGNHENGVHPCPSFTSQAFSGLPGDCATYLYSGSSNSRFETLFCTHICLGVALLPGKNRLYPRKWKPLAAPGFRAIQGEQELHIHPVSCTPHSYPLLSCAQANCPA